MIMRNKSLPLDANSKFTEGKYQYEVVMSTRLKMIKQRLGKCSLKHEKKNEIEKKCCNITKKKSGSSEAKPQEMRVVYDFCIVLHSIWHCVCKYRSDHTRKRRKKTLICKVGPIKGLTIDPDGGHCEKEDSTGPPCQTWFDAFELQVSGSEPAAGDPDPRSPSCWPPTLLLARLDSRPAGNTRPTRPSNLQKPGKKTNCMKTNYSVNVEL